MSGTAVLPRAIAEDPEYRNTHERREEAAAAARRAQKAYRSLIAGFIAASCIAAVVGGFVLYGADTTAPNTDAGHGAIKALVATGSAQVTLRALQAVAVAVAAFCAFTLNARDY